MGIRKLMLKTNAVDTKKLFCRQGKIWFIARLHRDKNTPKVGKKLITRIYCAFT